MDFQTNMQTLGKVFLIDALKIGADSKMKELKYLQYGYGPITLPMSQMCAYEEGTDSCQVIPFPI
jgi:hypothetical protein